MSSISAVHATPWPVPRPDNQPSSSAPAANAQPQAQGRLPANRSDTVRQTAIASNRSALSKAQTAESQAAALVAKDQTKLDVTV